MNDLEKKSYAMGVAIGSNYVGTEWDAAAFADGFMNITSRQPLKLDMEEIQRQLELFQQQMTGVPPRPLRRKSARGRPFWMPTG